MSEMDFERIPLEEIEALGSDYLGKSQMFGKPLPHLVEYQYGVFLITIEEELFLVSRCSDLITALDETHKLMTKFRKGGHDCNVYLSDGCKAILQCTFLAGQEWSDKWMGDSIGAEYEDEE